MQEVFQIKTNKHNGLFDITSEVSNIVNRSKVKTGIVNVYVQGATAGIMIQENYVNMFFRTGFVSTRFLDIFATNVNEL